MLNSAPFGLKICSEVSTAFVFNSQAEFLICFHFEHLLETQDVVLTLEGALATFISKEVLVLSLSGGELYVVRFLTLFKRTFRVTLTDVLLDRFVAEALDNNTI